MSVRSLILVGTFLRVNFTVLQKYNKKLWFFYGIFLILDENLWRQEKFQQDLSTAFKSLLIKLKSFTTLFEATNEKLQIFALSVLIQLNIIFDFNMSTLL